MIWLFASCQTQLFKRDLFSWHCKEILLAIVTFTWKMIAWGMTLSGYTLPNVTSLEGTADLPGVCGVSLSPLNRTCNSRPVSDEEEAGSHVSDNTAALTSVPDPGPGQQHHSLRATLRRSPHIRDLGVDRLNFNWSFSLSTEINRTHVWGHGEQTAEPRETSTINFCVSCIADTEEPFARS